MRGTTSAGKDAAKRYSVTSPPNFVAPLANPHRAGQFDNQARSSPGPIQCPFNGLGTDNYCTFVQCASGEITINNNNNWLPLLNSSRLLPSPFCENLFLPTFIILFIYTNQRDSSSRYTIYMDHFNCPSIVRGFASFIFGLLIYVCQQMLTADDISPVYVFIQ